MAKAVILLGVALLAGLIVYWIAGGLSARTANGRAPTSPTVPPDVPQERTPSVSASRAAPSGPIEPPVSAEQREHDAIEYRRNAFYVQLQQSSGILAAARSPSEDAATLDLYAMQDKPGMTAALQDLALRANAYYYGFRHIRFYLPNPPDLVERYRLDAEASADATGNWQTFQK